MESINSVKDEKPINISGKSKKLSKGQNKGCGCDSSSKSSSSSSCSSSSSSSSSCSTDDECVDYELHCWPVCPKPFCPPCKYTCENIKDIPNGSLAFIATTGPLADLNSKVTRQPFNLIGIIIQSCGSQYGTYVYTVETIYDGCCLTSKVGLIALQKFINDPDVIAISVRVLKGFQVHCYDQSNILSKPQWHPDDRMGVVYSSRSSLGRYPKIKQRLSIWQIQRFIL